MATPSSPVRVAIIAATGYGGIELLRWLIPHPAVEIVAVASSDASVGKSVADIYPHLSGLDLTLQPASEACCAGDAQVVFFATPNGQAMQLASQVLQRGAAVIDLSADFRIKDVSVWEHYYQMSHAAPALLAQAVYGIPELYRDQLQGATLIANPGCYPTSALLALVPLLRAGVINPQGIIVDSKSGVSGAGRTALKTPYLYAEANEDVSAYNFGTHRHIPEMEQQLTGAGAGDACITFAPHLVPITRGIFTATYSTVLRPCTTEELIDIYRQAYKGSPFVKVLDSETLPHTKWCYGSNRAFVTARFDARTGRIATFSSIDNLGKGMSGQAVQNMNVICGLPETLGLEHPAVYP